MKKTMVILIAVGLFGAMPAFADHKKDVDVVDHDSIQMRHDQDCAKECDLLLNDCAMQVDSIQQRLQRIKSAIKTYGAKPENLDELKILNKQLKEANETLRALNKPGR